VRVPRAVLLAGLALCVLAGFGFAAAGPAARPWGAVPRRPADRFVAYDPQGQRFDADTEGHLAASVYSLPSFFFDLPAADAFLTAVRAAAPGRTLIVLTDSPLKERLAPRAKALSLRLLDTHGRAYTPWPRDPFTLVHAKGGGVRVLVRPNLQPGREEDANLGPELVSSLPDDLDRAWGKTTWTVAPVPFHNGQVLLTRDAAWLTIHALEPRILALLGLDRVPVASFGTGEGIDRYLAAADQAAAELGTLYGRPVRFVHPLPRAGTGDQAARTELMRRIGGAAGTDLDSIVTFVPTKKGGAAALVADVAAGRDLLARLAPGDWNALRTTYGLEPTGEPLATALAAAQRTDAIDDLGSFLDLAAEHLKSQGLEVRRLPVLAVPVPLLHDHAGLSHASFLITWNNVVVENRKKALRAEGFASLIPAGDRIARDTFANLGIHLDLFPPLVRSVILNGGYRCASNHLRVGERPKLSKSVPQKCRDARRVARATPWGVSGGGDTVESSQAASRGTAVEGGPEKHEILRRPSPRAVRDSPWTPDLLRMGHEVRPPRPHSNPHLAAGGRRGLRGEVGQDLGAVFEQEDHPVVGAQAAGVADGGQGAAGIFRQVFRPHQEPAAIGRGRKDEGAERGLAADGEDRGGAGDRPGFDFHQVGLAQEGGHEGRLRTAVEIQGIARLHHAAVVEHQEVIGQEHGLFLVVGDVESRGAQLAQQGGELGPHAAPQAGVESREGLVEEQQGGARRHRPGQGHPLLLTARELRGFAVQEAIEAQQGRRVPHPLFDVAARRPAPRAAQGEAAAAGLQAEGDVLPHGEMREEGVGLEDDSHVPPLGGHARHVLAVEQDLPLKRVEQAAEELEKRRLARAGRADHHRDGRLRQLHGDAGDDRLPAVGEGDVLDVDSHAGTRHLLPSPLAYPQIQNLQSTI
jgi:hypothetical protein